ncbi:MAG: FAD-dependent oxidoreductase [Proteobacteria bacterium]|nr:FAD-dependent oxidoreductase [Pseudomonadota bacterium]
MEQSKSSGRKPDLFSPIKVGGLEIRNRIIMPALVLNFPIRNNDIGEDWLRFYRRRAEGGVGLIIVGACYVQPEGQQDENQLGLDHDGWLPTLEKIARVIKDGGAVPAAQLNHAGRYSLKKVTGRDPVAPSALASRYTKQVPRELETQEVEQTIEAFADAALRARKTGFEAVELLGATGYLISQFLSPITNQRKDRFGGDFRDRLTFVKELIARIKETAGPEFPIIFRLSSKDSIPGGLDAGDQRELAKKLAAWGVGLINVTAGWHDSAEHQIGPSVPHGRFVSYASKIKQEIDIPVSCAVRITSPEFANDLITQRQLDMVTLGRALIADPDWPRKAESGKPETIRKCVCCCHCFDIAFSRSQIECTANAALGKEDYLPVRNPKRILVVGGGPAGMEAARILAQRGHDVVLEEKSEKLGGQLKIASVPPNKSELFQLVEYQSNELKRLGVEIRTGTPFNGKVDGFDGIIAAVGAKEKQLAIPGRENIVCCSANQVLSGCVEPQEPVVIVGAGLIGGETADFLCSQGKKVSLVEVQKKPLPDMGPTLRWVLLGRLKKGGVEIHTSSEITEIQKDRVSINSPNGEVTLPAKSLIFAVGLESSSKLVDEIKTAGIPYCTIGDNKEPRRIKDAIHEGYWAATSWVDSLE